MRSGKVSESDARTLEEICGLIGARAKWYGSALLQAVLVRKNQDEWANFFTKVSMVHESSQTASKRCLDYGSLAILEVPFKAEE